LTLVAFSVGNIVGTEIFQPKDAPGYIPGKIAIMVLLTVQLGVSFLLRWINLRLNKKKQAAVEEMKRRKGWTDEDVQRERNKHAFADLTDIQWVCFVHPCSYNDIEHVFFQQEPILYLYSMKHFDTIK
jgi:hypothetical protein